MRSCTPPASATAILNQQSRTPAQRVADLVGDFLAGKRINEADVLGVAQDLASQFIARDGRTEAEQLTDLLNKARNKMADHMATHGCYRCARTFVRGFTSIGPNPEAFCKRGMELLVHIAFITKTLMGGESAKE